MANTEHAPVPEEPPATAVTVTVDWETTRATSRTELTTHAWTAPPLRRGTEIHDPVFAALRDLKTDYSRFLAWWAHPLLSVPELEPPDGGETSWDFTNLDMFVDDFLEATEGRPVVANIATIPTWMFDTPERVPYGEDPEEIQWNYEQGREFRDPSLTEVAEYFERIARWYLAGGFHDENGRWHGSGREHRFAYWEVLCEPDFGHEIPPETYTKLYDEVVKRLRTLDPDMRFIGLSLAMAKIDPQYFWHFLNPANHEDGIPLDAISYHLYAWPDIINPMGPEGNPPFDHWPGILFAQADGFVSQVQLLESIKHHLSPNTETHINEIGTFAPDMMNADPRVPADYWALSGAVVAYLWSQLTELGIDLVGIAEFMDYPGMIPSLTLVDWETGAPNARYWAAKLLIDNFRPGDTLVDTMVGHPEVPDGRVHARGFVSSDGRRTLLLVNKRPEPIRVTLGDPGQRGEVTMVDTSTGAEPPKSVPLAGDAGVELGGFATAVATLD
ncbi:hypothetical protein F4561_006430 [Lipingzhangella halophila]|uniref:D-apionate lactonase C-terminal domain-containing protein n=1 Tax=Lipingzhangella halophila TaxID=1783352 RepID=A0A7W7W6A6_9ACTN|nr:hypothetical protein [Lipingzhangella halophila]MBB4935536.1 hypothetical protein [Lipingzhangella halophila]